VRKFKIEPLWRELVNNIKSKHDINFDLSNLEKLFGVTSDTYITFVCLSLKYYIYICRFQDKKHVFLGFKGLLKSLRNSEYQIAKKIICPF